MGNSQLEKPIGWSSLLSNQNKSDDAQEPPDNTESLDV